MADLYPKMLRSGSEARMQFTIPTVASLATSLLHTLNIFMSYGTISQIDISYSSSSDAIITVSLYNSLEEGGISLFEIFSQEEISGVSSEVNAIGFMNSDIPQCKKLYVKVTSTDGTKETGDITLTLNIGI